MLVNLTPHDVVVLDADGNEKARYEASGEVARLTTIDLGTQNLPTVGPVEMVEFGHLDRFIPIRKDVFYIVSLPTALATHREDFVVPYLEVRDEAGRIIGCRHLARVMG